MWVRISEFLFSDRVIGRLIAVGCLSSLLAAAPQSDSKPVPKSSERPSDAFVVDRLSTKVTFDREGLGFREYQSRIRIQSDGALQQFGVLSFQYRSESERLEIAYVRVTKPDGRVIGTPESNTQDLPTDVTRGAPTYSDSREKQIPVKALGVGDMLEWSIRVVRRKADVPGQFWFTHQFSKDGTILEEILEISGPADKYLKVASANLQPNVVEADGIRTYTWKTAHTWPKTEPEARKAASEKRLRFDVQATTYKSWEEVGNWYAGLQSAAVQPTPAIREKAAELTRGLKTDEEKARTLYRFVSGQFRYIGVWFGAGRFQPHTADEILNNQYGDCKDKHTLLAALFAAAGIEAWPALIGADIEFDSDTPSPAVFNHVITYLPGGKSVLWLDSTPTGAAYGMLQLALRDQTALVIPTQGPPQLITTSDTLPFAAEYTFDVKASLNADGTLTGHFDITARGDEEVLLKSAFQGTPPTQWTALVQNISAAMGFGGIVRQVQVENLTDTEAPLHYSYSYERKGYSDWKNRRLTPPFPPLAFQYSGEEDAPTEPIELGAPGKVIYRASLELPPGYSASIPTDMSREDEFLGYKGTYTIEKGVLKAERILSRKKAKLPVSAWKEYGRFVKATITEMSLFIQLVRSDDKDSAKPARDNAEAAELVTRAYNSIITTRQFNAARDALEQAGRINSDQSGLWLTWGAYYEVQNQKAKALECMQKEVDLHPGDERMYKVLAALQVEMGKKEDASATLRKLVKMAPEDASAASALGKVLIQGKHFDDAADVLRTALKATPSDSQLHMALIEALLRGGKKDEGLVELAELRKQPLDHTVLNNVAWILADTNTRPALALELAETAITELQKLMANTNLSQLSDEHFDLVLSLAATWDTEGWAWFQQGDLAKAEQYVRPAWVWLQNADAGDHLGQIYQRRGNIAEAIHMYRLALAAKNDMEDTRERLRKLGGSEKPIVIRRTPGAAPQISPGEELSRMRTIPVPGLQRTGGSAEFTLLVSASGIQEVQFDRGSPELKPAASTLAKLHLNLPFPDAGPEKLARRGILACSKYSTPSCSLVLLLPKKTQKW